ncbi:MULTISPECIES: response regulator transcription factor [unclassified Brevundimonas]|uniref:response regulator transcription factor n=1 Tax=unclassified Brevundimonas TaxID=2622653 RepID=UPI0025C4C8E8|nr:MULTISPECIES: response regulator transcription factor [unclassified Brevundimonas]
MKIAVLDDDQVQLQAISQIVEKAGYRPSTFSRGHALISALRRDTFDLLIVDWNLPDRSGIEIVGWVRANLTPPPPMLLVTSRVEDDDIVAALNAGADDYLAKPISPMVLEARIRALLRRAYEHVASPAEREVYDDIVFNVSTTTVVRDGVSITMTPKEFALARLLFRNLHRALSRTYLLETIWGNEPHLNSRSLDMHISRVRSKLNLRPQQGYRLTPVYSYGYRLERSNAEPGQDTAPQPESVGQ